MTKRGFTLIEILIVIAIVAIFASVVFVALDPLTRFKDARDADRWRDVNALLTAIKVDQVDNKGSFLRGVVHNTGGNIAEGGNVKDVNYMISNANTTTGCNVAACPAVTATARCTNLQGLVTEGYLSQLPVSPNGSGSWTDTFTGYYLTVTSGGVFPFATSTIKISACEAENASSISVSQ